MKRISLSILLLVLLTPLALGQGTPYIGVVAYNLDALGGKIADYGLSLASGMGASVDVRETSAATFCTRNELSERLTKISHWVSTSEAVLDLATMSPAGIVLMPPPPIADAEAMMGQVAEALRSIPTVFVQRPMAGVDAPLFGVDMARLGLELGKSMSADGPHPFAVIGYFDDPMQASFLESLKQSVDFKGAYPAFEEYGKAQATAAFQDIPDLEAIVVADPSYVPGVLEVTTYTANELGRPIRVFSLGAPQDWKTMMAEGKLNGMVSWDEYGTFLQAVTALKIKATEGTALMNRWFDAVYYGPSAEPQALLYPYDQTEILKSFLN